MNKTYKQLKWSLLPRSFGVLVILFLCSFHFYIILSTGLKPLVEIYKTPITWWPELFQWSNFVDVFSYFPLLRLFFNSIFVAAGTIVGTLLIALPAAYALSHLDIRGKNPIMLFVLASQLFSPILIIFPLYRIMAGLNLLNTLWGVIIGDILYSLAFSVLLLTGFFRTVPKEVVECAHLDGASRMLVLRKILVPLAAPGIVVTVMYVFINTWNDFIFAFMFNNQMDAYTVIVGIYDLLSRTIRGVVRWDYIMVAAFYSSLPILILFIGMSKRLVGGLTVGAVKG